MWSGDNAIHGIQMCGVGKWCWEMCRRPKKGVGNQEDLRNADDKNEE